jgi:hypothetical protein
MVGAEASIEMTEVQNLEGGEFEEDNEAIPLLNNE